VIGVILALAGLAIALVCIVVVLAREPDAATRLVAVDALAACAVGGCLLATAATGATAYLDVAIGFSVAAFLGTVAWARTLERPPGTGDAGEEGDGP
jgi:multicomponent Na+:H+ antiporter subunit F